jgi:hypothetical protein
MPDISMCPGTHCPQANDCYRFRAIPNEYRQSYFMTPPLEDGKCDYFWSTEGYTRLQPIEEKK